MKSLPAALRETVNSIGAGKPYAWLFAIVADEDYETEEGLAMYVTSYDQPLTYENLLPLPVENRTYHPFGAQIGTIQVDTAASTPAVTVSVSNVFREVSYRLEEPGSDRILGKTCVFAAVNVDHLADGPILGGAGRIRGAVVNNQVATFSVELYGLSSYQIPQAIFVVDRCAWLTQGGYGGEGCGFPLDLVNGGTHPELLSCPGTLEACTERGDYEVSIGRPRRHPVRARLFLALPRLLRR